MVIFAVEYQWTFIVEDLSGWLAFLFYRSAADVSWRGTFVINCCRTLIVRTSPLDIFPPDISPSRTIPPLYMV